MNRRRDVQPRTLSGKGFGAVITTLFLAISTFVVNKWDSKRKADQKFSLKQLYVTVVPQSGEIYDYRGAEAAA